MFEACPNFGGAQKLLVFIQVILEKGKVTHYSILAWRIPWMLQSMGSQRVRHDLATFAFTFPKNIQHWFPFNWLLWSPCITRTLKSLLQHHSSKASIVLCSTFFMAELLYQYMATGKTTGLIIQIFASKVMALIFNMLSRFVSFSSKEQASSNFLAAVTVHKWFWSLRK